MKTINKKEIRQRYFGKFGEKLKRGKMIILNHGAGTYTIKIGTSEATVKKDIIFGV